MNEPSPTTSLETSQRESEFQDAHYHDEDPEIQNDDVPRLHRNLPVRKPGRRTLLKRRHYED